MRISVDLPQEDVGLLDACARDTGTSRSAVMHHAIGLLREARLVDDYAAAWAEWEGSEDAALWDGSGG